MKLNLGCGQNPLPDFVNHDLTQHADYIDVAWDLRNVPWPWEDGTAHHINAWMVLEHLPEVIPFFDECHRILADDCALDLCVPHYQSPNVAIDPTHYRGFHVQSCDMLDPDTRIGQKAMHYTDRKWKIVTAKRGVENDHDAVRYYLVKR